MIVFWHPQHSFARDSWSLVVEDNCGEFFFFRPTYQVSEDQDKHKSIRKHERPLHSKLADSFLSGTPRNPRQFHRRISVDTGFILRREKESERDSEHD